MPVRTKVALAGRPEIAPPAPPRNPPPKALREKCRDAALAAADWFARSQVRMSKPYWDANDGRFLYNYHMKTKTPVLGIRTQDPLARGAFRGEDEPVGGYIPGTDPTDYVNTRNTCYAALACFKLAGKPWPVGYTAFGT